MMTSYPIAASTGLLGAIVGPPDWTSEDSLANQLRVLRDSGFKHLDISDIWFDIPSLDGAHAQMLSDVINDVGLSVIGASVVGLTIDSPAAVDAAHSRACAGLENAISLGADILSIGLHNAPARNAPRTPDPQFPWMSMLGPIPITTGGLIAAAEVIQQLADRAADKGVQVSLEMNEMSILSTGQACLELLDRVNRPNVGINPDLGSLVRVPWGLSESWQKTVELVAPYTNYWHVKNCHRIPIGGDRFATTPAPLSQGVLDYRYCLRILQQQQRSVPIVIEHYGGDVLWFAQDALAYLHSLSR